MAWDIDFAALEVDDEDEKEGRRRRGISGMVNNLLAHEIGGWTSHQPQFNEEEEEANREFEELFHITS